MDEPQLRLLLDDVGAGRVSPDEATRRLRRLPFGDLGFARVDHHRALRQGHAEAVYGPGKTAGQCADIVAELLGEPGGPVLLTRADDDQADAALVANPNGIRAPGPGLGLSTLYWRPAPTRSEKVVVVTAGTADLPVAGECVTTLAASGIEACLLPDCGVAGLHRLLASLDELLDASAVVVVAGMEGALASVVAGVVAVPVIGVPTSVGYGAALEGVTALLAMLTSCAAGVSVVGIDNGFGAAGAVLRLLGP
ncbi:MAG: nickel pincer cofactor biosynthesis protein LarB [Acidimicrobiales bacterium]